MIHVFRLGPFQAGRREAFAFGGIDESDTLVRPEVAPSDEEGLAAIAKRHGGPLRCEPALAAAGKVFGFEPGELPEAALRPRAMLTFGLALGLGPEVGRSGLGVLERLFEACAAFWKARPWDYVDSDDPIRVELRNGKRRVAEASVLGGGGEEFGLALYDEPGSIQRVAAAVSAGRMDAAARVASVAVTLDAEPVWAAEAFDDAFGLPRLPVPLRVRNGKASPAKVEELRTLVAVLEAVTALADSDDLEPSEATVEMDGVSVTARVALPEDADVESEELAEPMLAPEPLAPARRSERLPRNAPCPCGSGRKYKKCHLAEDEEREWAARGSGPQAEEARAHARRLEERDPIHALEERITADALALARRRWGKAFDPEGVLSEAGLDFATTQSLLGWCADHYRGPTGSTALELYLEERGAALDETGKRLTRALLDAWFSVHEVIAAEPGVSITLRDLLAGGEHVVAERTASRTVTARDVLLTRVVNLGDRAVLAGCHLRSLPPREGDLACRFARKVLRTRAKAIPAARLRELTADGALFAGWQELVRALDDRPPPHLQDTDGEDFLLTIDRFEVASGRGAQVIDGLLALPDAQLDDDDDGPVEVSFVRQGNAKGLLPTTLVGRATLEGNFLRLETNSIRRADRLRKLVQERLGETVTFRIRQHVDPVAGLHGKAKSSAVAPEPMPPEALELVKAMQAKYYRRWLDDAIPALGGLTPRAAAKRKGAPREALRLLLAEIEHSEARQPAAQRYNVASLRQELGID